MHPYWYTVTRCNNFALWYLNVVQVKMKNWLGQAERLYKFYSFLICELKHTWLRPSVSQIVCSIKSLFTPLFGCHKKFCVCLCSSMRRFPEVLWLFPLRIQQMFFVQSASSFAMQAELSGGRNLSLSPYRASSHPSLLLCCFSLSGHPPLPWLCSPN